MHLLGESNQSEGMDINCPSIGYDQFLQSLHCQFFHTGGGGSGS